MFRGDSSDHAVLCTEQATYEIKEAETSNSLLIFEELAFPEQAQRTSRWSSDSSSASSKSPDSVSNLPIIPITAAGDKLPQDDDGGDAVLRDEEIVVRTVSLVLFLHTCIFQEIANNT